MRRSELIDNLKKSPFRPFRLYVSDDGTFDIRHPEMLMVTRYAALIGMLESGENGGSKEGYPRIERCTTVDLLHVTRIEELPESQRRPT